MTDQEINIEIAKTQGWTKHLIDAQNPFVCTRCDVAYSSTTWHAWQVAELWCKNGKNERPPDYCGDLNAMHEVEQTLEYDQLVAMSDTVSIEYGVLPFHATARQRAEAFLRTIGKWKE